MKKRLIELGKKYGALTVTHKGAVENTKQYWECVCKCGGKSMVTSGNLNSGKVKSCGCTRKGINRGSKNGMWAGSDAKYHALHAWVKRRKPKPKLCECCGEKPPHDLANLSQQYKRDINDFEWICRKCHMTKDGRLAKFKRHL